MPKLNAAKHSNSSFHPSYVPVAVFVGGTSGVGEGMVEAFARYLGGRAHIIIVGRNEHAADEIISSFPAAGNTSTYEFLPCDLRAMENVHAVCEEIRRKVDRVNFLVLTAGYSSFVNVALTEDGLDLNLAMRYYQRFVFVQELLPLLQNAQSLGQDAHAMSVLGAGFGKPSRPLDLTNLGNTVTPRLGRIRVAMRGMMMSWGYTDAMLAYFASQNPKITFTHIHPGAVSTPGSRSAVDFDGLLTPLAWIINWITPWFAVSPAVCAEHMLYALLPNKENNVEDGGLFIRNRYGDIVSSHRFEQMVQLGDSDKTCVLDGIPMKGYGASDRGVRAVLHHSEEVTKTKDTPRNI
ncbi:hypothetical protein C8F01DRAFT_1264228 [Mycena amicta]|nr:hypothetical protein C8F01DRAFT_1264228 [Mycena amicta]